MKVVDIQGSLTADEVLEKAKGHYDSVLVIGWDKEDKISCHSSDNMTRAADISYLLSLTQHHLISGKWL